MATLEVDYLCFIAGIVYAIGRADRWSEFTIESVPGKAPEKGLPKRVQTEAWPWTNPSKTVMIARKIEEVRSVEIDPSRRMADIHQENNKVEF